MKATKVGIEEGTAVWGLANVGKSEGVWEEGSLEGMLVMGAGEGWLQWKHKNTNSSSRTTYNRNKKKKKKKKKKNH